MLVNLTYLLTIRRFEESVIEALLLRDLHLYIVASKPILAIDEVLTGVGYFKRYTILWIDQALRSIRQRR